MTKSLIFSCNIGKFVGIGQYQRTIIANLSEYCFLTPIFPFPMNKENTSDNLPDIRDGLTRKERIILDCLNEIKQQRGNRHIPAVMLYGRVIEKIDISVDEMQAILQGLTGNS